MGKPTGLAKDQQRALGALTALPSLEGFYLAGGSAIAWHLDHRRSNDIDLFSPGEIKLTKVARAIKKLPHVKIVEETDVALHFELQGTLVDVVAYPYPLLTKPRPGPEGCLIAEPIDLAVMKLAAVARRGLRRDFWDLKVLIESGLSLNRIVRAYLKRFGLTESDLYPVFKALTYFDDAEKDRSYPTGMTAKSWLSIKRFCTVEAARALRLQVRPRKRPAKKPLRR